MKNLLLMIGGGLCLALGAIGLALPVWPTTPFVLVAAACFSGCPAVYGRLCRIRLFREYIEHYRYHTPVTRASRVKSLVWLWGMLLVSMAVMQKTWLTLLLLGIGLAVTVHLLLIGRSGKKRSPEEAEE